MHPASTVAGEFDEAGPSVVRVHRHSPHIRGLTPLYLVLARWPAIALFARLYFGGTIIRIRIEERLLRANFGVAFEDYSHRVPALIPNPFLWCKL